MADAKQLKVKIKATQNIKKITNALEIISTLKLQKVKKQTMHLRDCMLTLIDMVAQVQDYKNLFEAGQQPTKVTKDLLIVVSTEKGLCGSLNSQLFKYLHGLYDGQQETLSIVAIGKKAKEYFHRRGYHVIQTIHIGDSISRENTQSVIDALQKYQTSGIYSHISLGYNIFKNTMKYIPSLFPLLPMSPEGLQHFLEDVLGADLAQRHASHNKKDLLIEPSLPVVKKTLYEMLMHYVLYGAIFQNKTCEFASRMLAMKGAKDNASTQIRSFTLAYNKARQDAITKEIIEVVGAKSVIE